jgi:hypothetical protein
VRVQGRTIGSCPFAEDRVDVRGWFHERVGVRVQGLAIGSCPFPEDRVDVRNV